jgi:glycerol-3-phosphate acyltransferase PlsY
LTPDRPALENRDASRFRFTTWSPTMLLIRIVHVLAVGLWFGSAVFFSFPVALSLFGTLEGEARKPASERSVWFPLPDHFDKDPQSWKQPDTAGASKPLFADAEQLRKDQGTRAAGVAISPMFDAYFLVQGVCSLLALLTAVVWWNAVPGRGLHRARVVVLLLASLTVAAGLPLEQKVSKLRVERGQLTDKVLEAAPNFTAADYEAAIRMRADFGRWHTYSLLLNLATIALVTVAMAMTARLPSSAEVRKQEPLSSDAGRLAGARTG